MTAPAADLDNLGNDMPEAGHEGDAMPNPDPGSSAAGESGADPGDAMPNPDPGSSAAGESGAEPGDGHEVLCLRGGGGESSEEEEGSVSDGARAAASARCSSEDVDDEPDENTGDLVGVPLDMDADCEFDEVEF